ncbi:MAG: hypothetical protein H0X67_05835 [Acidobacteria bacterium]|nr:hypothetical protein [Acidobacteriota bacterium]
MTTKTRYFMAGSAAVLAGGLATGLIAYYSGGFQPVSASAVSTELRYVPADATLVAYADVRAIMGSELRTRFKQAVPMHADGQREFQEQTGIDIERDIDYVVAALSPGAKAGAPLVVARGRFNAGLLETLAREHGGQVEDYKGKRLVVGSQERVSPEAFGGAVQASGRPVLAFLEPGLLAIGDLDAVKKSIDAQLSAHSITSNDEMMQLVGDMGQYNNAWAVGRFDVIARQANLPEQVTSRIPPVKWFAVAGHINGGVSGIVRAEARDDRSAEDLRAVVNGFLALARLQAQSDPRSASIVNSLQLSGQGTTVALQFTLPAELLNMLPQGAVR